MRIPAAAPVSIYLAALLCLAAACEPDRIVSPPAALPGAAAADVTVNQAPTADPGGPYVSRMDSAVVFDAGGSSDPEGSPLNYEWDFGDGWVDWGPTTTHQYIQSGTFTVTLVVSDTLGAVSAPVTTTVTITSALVTDRFKRLSSPGWGIGDTGHSWFIDPWLRQDFRVDGRRGLIVAPDNAPRNVIARGAAAYGMNIMGTASFSIDQFPQTGSFFTIQTYCRRDDRVTDGDNYYRLRLRAFGPADSTATSGRIDVRIGKRVAGVFDFISPDNIRLAATWAPNVRMRMRWQCFGTSPATVVRIRVWRADQREPTAWDHEVTVDEPALDLAGTTGFRVEGPNVNSTGRVVFPVTFAFDDLIFRLR